MMLQPLMQKYDSFIVTERTEYSVAAEGERTYYLAQVNRREWVFPLKMIRNTLISLYIMIKERPDVVICTGVLAMIPLCLLVKMFGGKLIYIESFAKVLTATQTGDLLYKHADRFYVQWESMLEIYPNAIYIGSVY